MEGAARDHTQVMIKGKRTRRRNNSKAPPGDHSSSLSTTHCSNESNTFYAAASSLQESEEEEEEEDQLQDMANCLILLARGHNFKNPSAKSQKESNRGQLQALEAKSAVGLYQCKTCDRTFPSFQALGGHRASHNKVKLGVANDQIVGVQELDQEEPKNSNLSSSSSSLPNLSLQSLYNLPPKKPPCLSNKVHECSICGAEFMSGQALGGHMRRHRVSSSTTTSGGGGATVAMVVANSNMTTTTTSLCLSNQPIGFHQSQNQESREDEEDGDEQLHLAKKSRMVMSLDLDLNLPAPEDGGGGLHHHLNFPSKQQEAPLVLHNLVGCHY